jgi:hypothetical protein
MKNIVICAIYGKKLCNSLSEKYLVTSCLGGKIKKTSITGEKRVRFSRNFEKNRKKSKNLEKFGMIKNGIINQLSIRY